MQQHSLLTQEICQRESEDLRDVTEETCQVKKTGDKKCDKQDVLSTKGGSRKKNFVTEQKSHANHTPAFR